MTRYSAVLAAALVFTSAAAAGAQDIAATVKQVRNGTVRLTFASAPGVCGDGERMISRNDERSNWSDWRRCEEGPLRVALSVTDGEVVDVRTSVGRRWKDNEPALTVSASAAVDYLLDVVATNNTRAAERAILPVVMADSVEPWPRLLRIAKNERIAQKTRKSAVFWIGQAAAEAATRGLQDMVGDPGDIEVRKAAIFALSQQRTQDAVTALIEIVKHNPEKELKKSALFWLGQSDDPRVIAMFEEILLKK